MRKVSVAILICLLSSTAVFAQDKEPEMADLMRSNGKIYVVVLVLAAIFAGLIAYLVRLDMKLTRLEKSNQS